MSEKIRIENGSVLTRSHGRVSCGGGIESHVGGDHVRQVIVRGGPGALETDVPDTIELDGTPGTIRRASRWGPGITRQGRSLVATVAGRTHHIRLRRFHTLSIEHPDGRPILQRRGQEIRLETADATDTVLAYALANSIRPGALGVHAH